MIVLAAEYVRYTCKIAYVCAMERNIRKPATRWNDHKKNLSFTDRVTFIITITRNSVVY